MAPQRTRVLRIPCPVSCRACSRGTFCQNQWMAFMSCVGPRLMGSMAANGHKSPRPSAGAQQPHTVAAAPWPCNTSALWPIPATSASDCKLCLCRLALLLRHLVRAALAKGRGESNGSGASPCLHCTRASSASPDAGGCNTKAAPASPRISRTWPPGRRSAICSRRTLPNPSYQNHVVESILPWAKKQARVYTFSIHTYTYIYMYAN